MTVSFVLDGLEVQALNGGPHVPVHRGVLVPGLRPGPGRVRPRVGRPDSPTAASRGQCGWLKDRWGLSWQVIPTALPELLGDPDPGRAGRAMNAMLTMSKIDVAALRAAADAEDPTP